MDHSNEQLPSSKLYTFINKSRTFTLHFLEGQTLISDLIISQHLEGEAFRFFRNATLSVQPIVALLKQGESFGFYIDSKKPHYYFKLETNFAGKMRCVLKPDNLETIPDQIEGIGRLTKILPHQKEPYTSNVELKGIPLEKVINEILVNSFQMDARIEVSEKADQSIMLTALPQTGTPEEDHTAKGDTESELKKIRNELDKVFSKFYTDPEKIIASFENIGYEALAMKEIQFECGCSKDRFIHAILPMYKENPDDWFGENETELVSQCDYCKKNYTILKSELDGIQFV